MARILVVEDDVSTAMSLQKNLIKAGHEVFLVHDGALVMVTAFKVKPQFIIMDILLPNINGSDLVKVLRRHEEFRAIPIIFLTGLLTSSTTDKPKESLLVDGERYIAMAKPYDMRRLLNILEQYV